jgi:nanoRNase/pAp phosphatase (c-di-AMP/oligoRNAs hydrolase)
MLRDDPLVFRRFVVELVEWLRGKGRILIVTHDNPDPDALASAFALQQLLLVKTGQEAVIAHGGIVGRRENQAMVAELGIPLVALAAVDPDGFPVVCMVDTQPGAGNNAWRPERPVDVVIDHHPLQERTSCSHWVDVRESYGACATILFEYLALQDVYIGTKLATMLLYAIKTETQDLGREWIRADREAYQELVPLCNNHILARIVRPKVPHDYFACFDRAIAGARLYESVLVFDLGTIESPDIVAEMADFLLRAEGVITVFGFGVYAGAGILSMRRGDENDHAGELMGRIVAGLGTGGGHAMIAGGQIPRLAAAEPCAEPIFNHLVERLLDELQVRAKRPRRLLARRAGHLR